MTVEFNPNGTVRGDNRLDDTFDPSQTRLDGGRSACVHRFDSLMPMPVPLIKFCTDLMSELANLGKRYGIGIKVDAKAGWLCIARRLGFVFDDVNLVDATLRRYQVDEAGHAPIILVVNARQDCIDLKAAFVVYHGFVVVLSVNKSGSRPNEG